MTFLLCEDAEEEEDEDVIVENEYNGDDDEEAIDNEQQEVEDYDEEDEEEEEEEEEVKFIHLLLMKALWNSCYFQSLVLAFLCVVHFSVCLNEIPLYSLC